MPRFCGNCGTPVDDTTGSCKNCGASTVVTPLPPPSVAPRTDNSVMGGDPIHSAIWLSVAVTVIVIIVVFALTGTTTKESQQAAGQPAIANPQTSTAPSQERQPDWATTKPYVTPEGSESPTAPRDTYHP